MHTFLATGAIIAMVSCAGEIKWNEPAGEISLSVGIEQQTKTSLGNLDEGVRPIYWADGDRIAINGIESSPLEGTLPKSNSAVFHFETAPQEPYSTLYPSSIYTDATTVTLPRRVVSGVLPLGGSGLSVKALTSMVRINITKGSTDAVIKNITVTSKGDVQLCGPFGINYNTVSLTGKDALGAYNSIVLDVCDTLSAETLSYFLPVPEGNYGFSIKVTDSEGRYTVKETSSAKNFVKGCIHNMPAFAFEGSDGAQAVIINNGTACCSVMCPATAPSTTKIVAATICSNIASCTGIKVPQTTSSAGEDAWEIIVGADAYEPAKDLYPEITYGSYMLRKVGRKILVSAYDLSSYTAVRNYLKQLFAENYRNGDLFLDESLLKDKSVEGVIGYIPPFKVDKNPSYVLQSGTSSDKDEAMQVGFTSCKDADFDNYCSALEAASYTTASENEFGTCRYATYLGNGYQVNVSLYKDTGLLMIVSEPVPAMPIWSIEGTEGSVPTLMMQICQDNVILPPKSHPCAYVIRLSDGRYFIYDTGSTMAADQLMDYMRSRNTFTDGKVHIAMIIISHPHDDHRCGLNRLASKYANEIVCDAVAFNMTNHKRQSLYTTSVLHGRLNEIVTAAAKLHSRCFCLRGGQVVNLAGAKLEVLFTPDELGTFFLSGVNPDGETDTTYDQNNSSNIVRLTVGGQTITFTGDCRGGEAGIFNSTILNSFESDIMTAAHHGYNVSATVRMYTKAKPFVIFWPVRQDEQDMTRYFDQELMSATYVKKHFFEETQVEIPLPYVID